MTNDLTEPLREAQIPHNTLAHELIVNTLVSHCEVPYVLCMICPAEWINRENDE